MSEPKLSQSLPEEFEEIMAWGNYKIGRIPLEKLIEKSNSGEKNLDTRVFHYCKSCKGWVNSEPRMKNENSLGPLCGRRGTSFHCALCNREIGYFGMVA